MEIGKLKQPFPCGHPCQPLRQSCRSSPKIQHSFHEKRMLSTILGGPWDLTTKAHDMCMSSRRKRSYNHTWDTMDCTHSPLEAATQRYNAPHLSMQSLPKAFLGSSVVHLEHLGNDQSKSNHDFQVIHLHSFSIRIMTSIELFPLVMCMGLGTVGVNVSMSFLLVQWPLISPSTHNITQR